MPLEAEPKLEWYVFYKPKADYDGDWNRRLKQGLHGQFDSLDEAREQAKKCKEFFTQEKSLKQYIGQDGKQVNEITVKVHDNVVVWIDFYKDDQHQKDWVDKDWAPEKRKEKAA